MKKLFALLLALMLTFPAFAETDDGFKLEFSGNGTDIITGIELPDGNIRVMFSQEEAGKYEITLMTDKDRTELLRGYSLKGADVTRKTGSFDLAVEANSPWTLVFESLGIELFFEGLEGTGDYVSDMFLFLNPIIVEIAGSVKEFDNFSVEFYYMDGMRWDYDLLVNELLGEGDSISHKKILKAPKGALGFFVINTDDGEWSIKEVK